MMRILPLALAALLALGCMTPPPGPDGLVDPDPYETQNRIFFAFNDGLDRVVAQPLARVWRFLTPRFVRTAIDNAFLNLRYPTRAVSCLGQGRPADAGRETLRFAVNTTLGLAGLWDAATIVFDIPFYDEDTGQMLAVWGVGSGPFWMIPILGPSNPRDTIGYVVDGALNLAVLAPIYVAPVAWVNGRAIAVPAVDRAREASLDYYLFVRDAYLQRRERQIAEDGPIRRLDPEAHETGPAVPDDEFYDVEDEAAGGEAASPAEPPETP
jgi:phospholipid-binding lipoprotein MlaA